MSTHTLDTLNEIVEHGVKLTPMMAQFYDVKKEYADHLVLFRMGDFYEVFFDDAKKASKLLNITLTHRGKLGDFPIPMAGIPHHAAAVYIDRLSAFGLKVAICEQVEDPKEAKGIVKRAVTQVVSPGLPFDLEKADSQDHKFIASAIKLEDAYYLAAIDFTTGEFSGHKLTTIEDFLDKLRMLAPKEFICAMGDWDEVKELDNLLNALGVLKTHLSKEYFEQKYTEIYIEKLIPAFKRDKVIATCHEILGPIGALSYYICSTQNAENFCHIRPFQMISEKGHMKVTAPTLIGLEILPKSRETYKDSLLGFLDKTKTAMGSRNLKQVFTNPLNDLVAISDRQNFVSYFLDESDILESVREKLSDVRDLERIMAKVSTNKSTAGDLINLAKAVRTYEELGDVFSHPSAKFLSTLKKKELTSLRALSKRVENTINDEIGAALEKGNLIKEGCDQERDRLAKLSTNTANELLELEARYREETGIQKLRVKSNNVAGYFIEVSKTHTDKVPDNFKRRQTLVNSERYTTEELTAFEKEIFSAKEKLERLEREIFKALISEVAENNNAIMMLSKSLGLLDVFQSFAWVAAQEDFTKPNLNEKRKLTHLEGAWHPLIKSIIKDQFVAHDLMLNEECFFGLITGPNMAGKTTVMREVAIVQLLAQVGSYVPAESANLGLCDYLFSRLGASDDILKGQSTFMVEMAETAEILRHATENSLIILDEVGRGTSTYDGLSIAWSLVEHFVNQTKALTLFATHYHELIEMVEQLPGAKNLTVETFNKDGDVQFLYRLIEEGASQSFGIYVAKLAGLPQSILERSTHLLKTLESENGNSSATSLDVNTNDISSPQLSFFGEPEIIVEREIPEHLQKLEVDLSSVDVMNMTPLEALNKLNQLKESLRQ
ncbi:putative DNA mismatch repair protein MutS [Halobacteriovorax marinus SJ]|uniref:DNA mismatch repair protein MutS n=1 Tax=Halobacteriovorax marinus (strain ATCC BAA-682 / DSM 15412 / SJ) TaxID=862908 RepID=E1WXD9_HALMS|nr:DNA mismatch repair protein MutS [Halobacteriovorax marinus]CBW27456.1 putative DNA mismatch repair protein MutS [Halobacteriovorax marinus SJ]